MGFGIFGKKKKKKTGDILDISDDVMNIKLDGGK